MHLRTSRILGLILLIVVGLPAPASHAAAASAQFIISPTKLDFGQVLVGTTSSRQSVNVTNVSDAPILMSGTGGVTDSPYIGSNNCEGKTVPVNGTCHMFFQFRPIGAGAEPSSSSGAWNGQSYEIDFTGVGVPPQLRISPTALDFGDVPLGTTGPTQTVKITNLGPSIVMSGAGGGAGQMFGGSQDCQEHTLDTGQSCHMFYEYAPSALGPQTGSTGGNWNGQQFSISFTGNGVDLPPGDLVPVAPVRVMDTRPATKPAANQQLIFAAAGFGPAPLSANALDVTVTALSEARNGSLTIWPCGSPMPTLPTMQFGKNTRTTDHVLATFNSTGRTCVQATRSTDVLVDMDGYYSSSSSYHPVVVQRIADTTGATRPVAGHVVHITIPAASVPAGSSAVALTLTAVNEAHAGHFTAFPCGSAAPSASALQFQSQRARSALAISKIGTNSQVCVRTSTAADLLADLTGYYAPTSSFTPIAPRRVLDTATPKAGKVVRANVALGSVPNTASHVVLDVTATSEAKAGTITVYGCGQAKPSLPAVQFQAGTPVTNLAVPRLFSAGKVCLVPSQNTHLAVDVVGWYS